MADESGTLIVPVSKDRPAEGTVTFESQLPDLTKMVGFFSFTLYTYSDNLEKFKQSRYYHGLKIYIEMIHTHSFFEHVGIIIYTTWLAQEMLEQLFPRYPKVIYAEVDCPRFVVIDKFEYENEWTSAKMLDPSVLRCMRFHAVEAFPAAWICVRDADTYFLTEIMTAVKAYESGYEIKSADGSSRKFPDPTPVLAARIGNWEELFITKWLQRGTPITLGVNFGYLADWHTEFPIVYPIKNATKIGDRFKDSDLYMQAPYGILAGFCSFAGSRPADIWRRMYDYLAIHYPVVSFSPQQYHLSNRSSDSPDSFIHYMGKDERLLLFALLPVYLSQCYFFYIFFNNSSKFDMCMNYRTITPFTCEALFDFSRPERRTDTVMLAPSYIYTVYWGVYTPAQFFALPILSLPEYVIRIGPRAKSIIENNYKIAREKLTSGRFTFHEYFAAIFEEFYGRFGPWYSSLMKAPADTIQLRIHKTSDAMPALTNANFYEPPRRIPFGPVVPARDKIWKVFDGGRRRTRRKSRKNR